MSSDNSVFKIGLKAFFLALFFIANMTAEACVASRDPRINFFISYEKPYAGLFSDGVSLKDIHPAIVDRCQQAAGKYLMVALAVRTQKVNGRTGDISMINKFKDDHCKIVNGNFEKIQTYTDKLKNFEKQYLFLRSCTFYDVVELEGNEIVLPEKQPSAKVEIISPSHIRAEGDFFYMKIRPNHRFAIGIGLKKECTERSNVELSHFEPGDVQALLNTYIAGDASGVTTDLTSVGSTRVRLALTPSSDLMKVSSKEDPPDVPSWPTSYRALVDFGTIAIKLQPDGRSKVDFTPLVDHFAPVNCVNGLCSSESSFQVPVSGMVELMDLGAVHHKVIDSWYFGAVAPGQYQGFLEGISRYLGKNALVIGKEYGIEMTMVDPNEDYQLFKNGLSQMLVDLGAMGTVAGIDVIEVMGALSSLSSLGIVSGFPGLVGADASQIILTSLSELNRFKGPQQWPPYFEDTCIDRDGSCFPHGKSKYLKKIGAHFKLGELQEDLNYQLKDLRVYSFDPIHGYREREVFESPYVECSIQR